MIDVKAQFGAVGDGETLDDEPINAAYAEATRLMSTPGGAGFVYFPPSKGFYKVSTLRTPSMGFGQGPLVSVFCNGLYVDKIQPGNNNAFVGWTSNFGGLSAPFSWGPSASWQQPKGVSGPLLDMAGGDQITFEGIGFGLAGQAGQPAVHMHDGQGCVNIVFRRCSVMGDFVADTADPKAVAGFGLRIEDCSLGRMRFQNFGQITIRGSFLHSIVLKNAGIASNGDLSVDDCLSEGLNNEDFLTVDTSGGTVNDITLRRVKLADTSGSVYLLKHVNNSGINWIVNVKIEMIPGGNLGSGFINPSSASNLLSVICEGANAGRVLEAKQCLYDAMLKGPKEPLIVYGSHYLNPPFRVEQGT